VIGISPDQAWLQKYFEYRCDDCGSEIGFRSRARTFSERYLLPIFLLQPVRCAECFRRDYRVVFMPVKQRTQREETKASGSLPQADRNVA